ncbi:SIR2 family protein [Stigmatella sp. ncwal1]|uniref:SIR2 family protein n=1 Tax=Stigmatella ashevillensis TaxID=2995309 RepID=A0ABT5D6K7_9BACT|nr:SIR2 family protein [Stigmatella ashevillena]MDC0708725.1 SIR2 family protein [Stigmatella ashevillena]
MTPKPPGSLIRYIQQSRCVVFVGAGLSAGAGLPTWRRLLLDVIDEVVASLPDGAQYEAELKQLVDQGKLLEVADYCKEQLGAAHHQFLTGRLRGDTTPLSPAHLQVMQLPFSAWVTTNYDKLLERAYSEVKGGFPKTLTHKDTDALGLLLFEGGPFILKAHGDIDRPETVVLTSRDYSEIIHANPAFNEVFTSLLLTKALLFVGFSLSDPDFRLLMDRQLTHFKGYVPDRFALMTGLGPVERDVLWRSARIRVIPYTNAGGKHEEVFGFLKALKEAVQPAPATAVGGGSEMVASKVVSLSIPAAPAASPPRLFPPAALSAPPVPAREGIEHRRTQEEGLLARLLGPLGGDSQAEMEESPEEVLVPALKSPPAAAPAPPPISSVPQHLFIERGAGRLQFRLTLGGEDSVAQISASDGVPEDLWPPLLQAIEERTPSYATRYARIGNLLAKSLPLGGAQTPWVLHPAAELERFPWELLLLQGREKGLERRLVRAPVGISAQVRGEPTVRSFPWVLLIEGAGDPSRRGTRETERLIQLYQGEENMLCTVLRGDQATFKRIMAQLDNGLPDLFHFVGDMGQDEGELCLRLPGGMDLSAGVLRSVLSRGRLPFMVLSAPFSAFAPDAFRVPPVKEGPRRSPVPHSWETFFEGRPGFMELATQTGVGAFVGCFGEPRGDSGTAFMAALHRELIAGTAIAEAVLRARKQSLSQFTDDATPLQYLLSGNGDLRLR